MNQSPTAKTVVIVELELPKWLSREKGLSTQVGAVLVRETPLALLVKTVIGETWLPKSKVVELNRWSINYDDRKPTGTT